MKKLLFLILVTIIVLLSMLIFWPRTTIKSPDPIPPEQRNTETPTKDWPANEHEDKG